jgi:hypothetical protein
MKKLLALLTMFGVFLTPVVREAAVADEVTYSSPLITESAKVGQTVRLTLATWPDATAQTFVWLVGGKVLTTAKTAQLKIISSMNAKSIQVKQTATIAGQTVTRSSNSLVVGKTTVSAATTVAFADATKTSLQVSGLKISPRLQLRVRLGLYECACL